MRLLLTLAVTACSLGADLDPAAIVRRSVLNDESQDAALRYAFTERSRTQNLNDSGQVRSVSSRTREIQMRDFERRRERYRKAIREIPEAFLFRLIGEEQIDTRPAYVIEALPKPGYDPVDRYSKLFTAVKARLWIDKSDDRWIKIEAELLDTITFGWILVRVHQGSRVRLAQARVAQDVWLPREMWYRVSVRVGLVSLRRVEVAATYGDYLRAESEPVP
jgi:hypothetical protein